MTTTEGVTARLLAAFEVSWKAIRDRHPEVPAVVMTVGSGTLGGRSGTVRYGHFAAGRWQVGESDQVAELFVSGESLSEGYLNRPEANDAKFLPNPIEEDPYPVLYRTGDVARYWPGVVSRLVQIHGASSTTTQAPPVQRLWASMALQPLWP